MTPIVLKDKKKCLTTTFQIFLLYENKISTYSIVIPQCVPACTENELPISGDPGGRKLAGDGLLFGWENGILTIKKKTFSGCIQK